MHDVFHSKARVPRVTWMHLWAKCCGGERLLPTNPIWFQTRPGPVEKCKKLFGRLSRRQWVWNSECVCMCVCGCSCHACRCSFQFNCLRLMAWVLRCHSNRRLMWIATVRVTSQSPSKSNALHVQEINGSTADILLELYDDQRKILGQNDTWAGSIDSYIYNIVVHCSFAEETPHPYSHDGGFGQDLERLQRSESSSHGSQPVSWLEWVFAWFESIRGRIYGIIKYNLKIIITYSNLYMNSEPCWRTWMDVVLAFLRQEFIIVHHFSILFFNCIMIQFKPGCWTTKRLPDVRCYCSLGHLKICDWLFSGTMCLPSSGESRLLACFRYVQNSLCGPHWMWGHRRIPVNPRLRLDDFSLNLYQPACVWILALLGRIKANNE